MNSRTKKIAFSSVSVLVVLAMLVGITMAWFTDTEKTNANFHAGVLNIEVTPGQPDPETNAMEFTNLRPMQLDAFQAELGENFANVTTEGFDPVPKYFHPVTVKNAGTLPAQIVLSMEDFGACENKIANVVDNGSGGVKQDGEIGCAEAYTLKDVLQIFVYEKTLDDKGNVQWVRAEGVDLNPENGTGSMQTYTIENPLGAGESADYVIAGYLPQTVGNDYQAKHFHANFVVTAGQADNGADIGNGEQPDPEAAKLTVVFTDPDREVIGTIEYTLSKGDGKKLVSEKDVTPPAGYAFSPIEQSHTVTVTDGVPKPKAIEFTMAPTEKFVKISYIDVTNQNEVVGNFNFPLGAVANLDKNITTLTTEVADNLPAGYAFTEHPQAKFLHVVNGVVNPAEVTFMVKPKDDPQPVEKFVTVNQVDVTDNNRVVKSEQVSMGTADTTKQFATDQFVAADGFAFVPGQEAQSVTLADGVVTPHTITFNVQPTTQKTTLVRFLNVEADNAEVGTYAYPLGVATNSVTNIEIATLTPPTGYVLVEGQGTQTVTVTGGVVDPSEFAVNVKPEGTTPPVDPDPNDPFPNGDGSKDNPFWITNQEELSAVREYLDKHFVVKNDFAVTYSNWKPIGSHAAGGYFTGSLNGDGYTISGLEAEYVTSNATVTPSRATNAYIGLFASNQGVIENLKMTNVYIRGNHTVGAIAGINNPVGKIVNCSVTGRVVNGHPLAGLNYGGNAGGITGENSGLVEGCYSGAEATGYTHTGSLVGKNFGTIRTSYSSGGVNANVSTSLIQYSNVTFAYLGSLAGSNQPGGLIENCYTNCSSTVHGTVAIGGFVGYNASTIRSCYSVNGSVLTTANLVGMGTAGLGHRCIGAYSTVDNPSASYVYYQSTATTSDANKGRNRTQAQLQSGTPYDGFDTNVWSFRAGAYPTFQ